MTTLTEDLDVVQEQLQRSFDLLGYSNDFSQRVNTFAALARVREKLEVQPQDGSIGQPVHYTDGELSREIVEYHPPAPPPQTMYAVKGPDGELDMIGPYERAGGWSEGYTVVRVEVREVGE